jgi:formylglycine-generating enzyme required for sulfatase activity
MRAASSLLIGWLLTLGAGIVFAAADERPAERVSPPPPCNPNAVIWRTPEPPADPQKGDVWVNPKDGMGMVYVPAGEFVMGSSTRELNAWLQAHPEDQYSWFAHEQPQCRVKLGSYWIGRTEVTNAQYLRFVEAADYAKPEHWHGGIIPEGLENFPVSFVEWEDARAYCKWAGGRLPSEPEWERAARGGDGRIFPWGNRWEGSRCRSLESIVGHTPPTPFQNLAWFHMWIGAHDEVREGPVAAGSYVAGASPFGCLDLAGNVWEWCADWYDEQAYQRYSTGDLTPPASSPQGKRVLRGGAFSEGHPRSFRCAWRFSFEPTAREVFVGFRVARDAAK